MPALDRRLGAVLCCAWLAGSVAVMGGATHSDDSGPEPARARAQLSAADAVDAAHAVQAARPATRLRRAQPAVVTRLLPITLLAVLPPGRAPIARALMLWRPPGFGLRLRDWTLGASIGSMLATAVLCACGVALRRHARRHARRPVHGTGGADDEAWPAYAGRAAMTPGPSTGSPERGGALALVCHEIRTPLHAIAGILELLLRKAGVTGEVRHYVETAHRCARSLSALASDMLDMARLDAGLLEIRPKAVNLHREVRQLVEEFQPLAHGRGLAIALHLSTAGTGPHRADPQRLRQILGNLLSNAIKFTERGNIAVTLESLGRTPDGERLRIVVRDHGAGIAPCDLERVFQPFFRCDGTSAAPGSGLGLAISRELTRRMGGELRLANHAGGGTEAVLTLTLQCVPPAIAYSPCAFPARATARTPYVRGAARTTLALVVDDHPASRLLLAEQLRLLGIDSVCAADGNEALARHAATGRPFDLVLTDFNMPGMTGHELVHALRRRERELGSPRCTVLGLSADARPDSRARAVEAGMDDYLCKPIDLDALARRLQRWLPAHRSPLATHAVPSVAAADSVRRALLAANAEDLPALQDAIDSACLPDAAQLAHRIRGAACMAAEPDVAKLAATLQEACEGGDIAAARAALRELRAVLDCWSLRLAC